MEKLGIAGNHGNDVKSDCRSQFELAKEGGLQIELTSRVKAFYGNSIIKLANEMLSFFDIKNAKLTIEDSGAVEFVLAARIEASIKKVIETEKEFILPILIENQNSSKKDQFRFSRLYLPGNSPKLMINAGIHKPNGLILDLEDAVAPVKKFEARFLVRNALRSLNFYGVERMVRINQIPLGLNDLDFLIPHYANLILVPKCESADCLHQVNIKINELKKQFGINNDVWLMPIIESAKGVMNAYEIVNAADNVAAVAIGLEDYTADIGTRRTAAGNESFFARSMVVTAAKAAGIQAIDSVFSDVSDMEALAINVRASKGLGFDGMGCIHPRQIAVIHENFAPEEAEIEKAKKIVLAFRDANDKGLGVVSLGTKMIDAPVVKRAQNTITLAINTGKLSKDWINNPND
ncbi:MAG: citrate lyase ACP [Bacteroidetes bacterium]|nr:citrate lyase ACP [Bacteroidota bacterium]MBL6944914.1 citrate lyase ACP [Bacteroidales bacterium]